MPGLSRWRPAFPYLQTGESLAMYYKTQEQLAKRYRELSAHFDHWEKTKDLISSISELIVMIHL